MQELIQRLFLHPIRGWYGDNAWHPVQLMAQAKSEISHKIATCRFELELAFRLVHDAYVRGGLMQPNEFGMRITPHHLLPTTEVLIAKVRREVFCTITMVRDGELGLPMDAVYHDEIQSRRDLGLVLAEASCLADRRAGDTRTLPAVDHIMAFLAQCAAQRGVNEILAAVHPRRAGFYERALGFEQFGETKNYASVRNSPAVALTLKLDTLAVDRPHVYQRLFGDPFPPTAIEYSPVSESLHREYRSLLEENAPPYALPRHRRVHAYATPLLSAG